jgi:hypothetical protein
MQSTMISDVTFDCESDYCLLTRRSASAGLIVLARPAELITNDEEFSSEHLAHIDQSGLLNSRPYCKISAAIN